MRSDVLSHSYEFSDRFVSRQFDKTSWTLLDLKLGDFYSIDGQAARVFSILKKGPSSEKVSGLLKSKISMSKGDMAKVRKFIQDLIDTEILLKIR